MHAAALLFTLRQHYFLGGLLAGIGFLFNAKSVLVLAACASFA
jgi:hypothetical protein